MIPRAHLALRAPVLGITRIRPYWCLWDPAGKARKSSSLSASDIERLLSKPTWSVKSLLPCGDQDQAIDSVSSNQLRHLLRLSALPPPSTQEEEAKMLKTLNTQLRFVREIQKVNTSNVAPLPSLRDETAEAQKDAEIGMEELEEAFSNEQVIGKHYKRIRRNVDRPVDTKSSEEWEVLGHTDRKVGNFFVVENTKDQGS
ncbi:MAG: hypothetical protein M1820_004472 [Bogoriella megaspora]|nr:MAG: hypothetical protein M1820_004472 [Bogoriella megaspora]